MSIVRATSSVRAICAIGLRGQLGHEGVLPWEGNPGRAFIADVERFFAITEGHVIAAGPRTVAAIPDFVRATRDIFEIRSSMTPQDVIGRFPRRVIYIGGGPAVWDVYAPYIVHWDITRLPYDGEADRWFNPAWLVQGGAGLGASIG